MTAADVTFSGPATFGGAVLVEAALSFEGASDDGFQTTLAIENPGAPVTVTLPDSDGTLVVRASDAFPTARGTRMSWAPLRP